MLPRKPAFHNGTGTNSELHENYTGIETRCEGERVPQINHIGLKVFKQHNNKADASLLNTEGKSDVAASLQKPCNATFYVQD